jgi:hypothetical protein
MLNQNDIEKVVDLLCGTAEAMGFTMSANAAAVMAVDLSTYPLDIIEDALHVCRYEVTGRLTLAAIMQRVQAADGRPGKDEAWSIALASSDEFDTVVITEEISLAMTAAQPILNLGDKVGARMAFMSAYERLVAEVRSLGKPAQWRVSIGFDAQRRVAAIEQAVLMKRISSDEADHGLISLAHSPLSQDAKAIAGLITGEASEPSPEIKDRLRGIRDLLQAKKKIKDEERRVALLAERNALAARVNQHVATVVRLQRAKSNG